MAFSSFVARRFLAAGRHNRFFSWISVLTIAGVAIGCAAMICVWSVINGFENELRKRFLAANAHIMAYRFPHGLPDYERWADVVQRDFSKSIRGVSPFIHYETMVRKKGLMHAMLIRGIDPAFRDRVQSLRFITQPPEALDVLQEEIEAAKKGIVKSEPPAIIVGIGLLQMLEAEVGDVIELVEPGTKDFGNMKPFKVVGVYDSGLKHYDNKLGILSIPTAQRFFKMGQRVHGLEIGLHQPWESKEIARQMSEKYSLSIREWQSFNSSLFEAMQMERIVILLITGLVATVAGFNILTTIFVSVTQKQRDISILKAIGASNWQVLATFLQQGLYVGIIGCIIGAALAYGICNVLERYQFIDLPDLYLLARLPVSFEWWVYASVCAGSLSIALLAGLIPAAIASLLNPVEGFTGIRQEVPDWVRNPFLDGVVVALTLGLAIPWLEWKQIKAINDTLGQRAYRFGRWLVLTILTLGLFHLAHSYRKARDLAPAGTSPRRSGLIQVVLWLLPPLWWLAVAHQQKLLNARHNYQGFLTVYPTP